jgi:hypothetical protein
MPQRNSTPRRKPQSPLAYLLAIVNDESADPARRDRAARAAAPYCHPRLDPAPKKAQREAAARKAGAGSEWGSDLKYSANGRPRQ